MSIAYCHSPIQKSLLPACVLGSCLACLVQERLSFVIVIRVRGLSHRARVTRSGIWKVEKI